MSSINSLDSASINNQLNINDEASKKTGADKSLGQEDFLKLMIAQVNQQDPMNPVNSTEFFSQIAQFNMVDGINSLQQSLAGISAGVFSNQALQASTMVGKTVHVSSNEGILTAENGMNAAIASDNKVYDMTVRIKDDNGKVIKELPLGEQEPGVIDFKWDGTGDDGTSYPPGQYHIEATATINGQKTNFQTLASSRVDSVTLGQGDSNVWLNTDGLGAVPLYDVWKIS